MIRKRNYDRAECFEALDNLLEYADPKEVLENMCRWFSTDDVADFLTDAYDAFDYLEDDDESEEDE